MDEPILDNETVLDELLESVPLTPLPSGFVDQVMAQVQVRPQAAPPARFRLEFLDWAIPVFGALFALLLLILWRPLSFLDFEIVFNHGPLTAVAGWLALDWLVIIGLLALAELFFAGVVGIWLWADSPGYSVES